MNNQNKKGIDLLADYVFLSKYSQKKKDGYLETWEETVARIYAMHREKLRREGLLNAEVESMLEKAQVLEEERKILSSQRGRQFASPLSTSGILKHESKMYNCSSTFIDRIDVFGEIMYLLLCGCGVGYSLHKEYVDKLPVVKKQVPSLKFEYVIPDTIEGWADSIKELMKALFAGSDVSMNYSQIRPEGSLIDGKFVAPGPRPLARAHANIRRIMKQAGDRKLTTLEIHDIICHIAEGVVSGGVRRSAMIALFDKDDDLMLTAKTGSWWEKNPQRSMANNSILCTLDDPMSYDELKEKLQVIRQFGEPGFVNVPSYDYVVNPCGEIVMNPRIGKETGFAFCNLVEINAERISSAVEFQEVCEVASFIATVQSLYTRFKYLSPASKAIAERDRAIGVSITGIYANPNLQGEILSSGARVVVKTNEKWASEFGINASRACTTVKPSGNASSILGLTCSGIHPAHARQYLRRVRIKTYSPEFIALKDTPMVKSLQGDEACITFPIVVDNENVVTKDQICAVDHLKFIGMVKHYWINKGVSKKHAVSNNVSATVEVRDDEWNEVAAVLYANNHLFTGVSFLPKLGDQIYDNAPFQRPSTDETKAEFDAIVNYLESHDVDFNEIMSNRDNLYSGDMAAIGCSGGACELK